MKKKSIKGDWSSLILLLVPLLALSFFIFEEQYLLIPLVVFLIYYFVFFFFEIDYESVPYKKKKDIEYYRSLPCNGNIYIMYYILCRYSKKDITPNFINAILVKWYRENKIEFIQNYNNDLIEIKFKKTVSYDHKAEQMFYHMIKAYALEDGSLSYNDLFNSFMYTSHAYAIFASKIPKYFRKEMRKMNFFEELDKLCGLEKYFNDFTIMNELKKEEVWLRDGYITYSILIGCSSKINGEFREFIPFKFDKLDSFIQTAGLVIEALTCL